MKKIQINSSVSESHFMALENRSNQAGVTMPELIEIIIVDWFHLLNNVPNDEGNDTTEADSSNADGNKKIPSIDWEGLEKVFEGWKKDYCKRVYSLPSPTETFAWLKNKIL